MAVADPANIAGAAATIANMLTPGATTSVAWNGGDPVVVLESSWAAGPGNDGLTVLGHVVALSATAATDPETLAHELAHVDQHDVLGPWYLQSHIGAQAWSWLTSGSYRRNNPLEQGPHETPPCAW